MTSPHTLALPLSASSPIPGGLWEDTAFPPLCCLLRAPSTCQAHPTGMLGWGSFDLLKLPAGFTVSLLLQPGLQLCFFLLPVAPVCPQWQQHQREFPELANDRRGGGAATSFRGLRLACSRPDSCTQARCAPHLLVAGRSTAGRGWGTGNTGNVLWSHGAEHELK